MYIMNGIAYAGEQAPMLKVKFVRPMEEFQLLLRFSNEENRLFDFKPLLEKPCYTVLKNKEIFDRVYIDYGCTVWNNGKIDIAPEYLYENSVLTEETEST